MATRYDIESEEFYNLMQNYRHAQVLNQKMVVDAYEKVKRYITEWTKRLVKEASMKYGEKKGSGKGRGQKAGGRRNKNRQPCKKGGPGYGKGKGRGSGKGRKK
jgi:hypothetical protein